MQDTQKALAINSIKHLPSLEGPPVICIPPQTEDQFFQKINLASSNLFL